MKKSKVILKKSFIILILFVMFFGNSSLIVLVFNYISYTLYIKLVNMFDVHKTLFNKSRFFLAKICLTAVNILNHLSFSTF